MTITDKAVQNVVGVDIGCVHVYRELEARLILILKVDEAAFIPSNERVKVTPGEI